MTQTKEILNDDLFINWDDGTFTWKCLTCGEETTDGWAHTRESGHCSYVQIGERQI